MKKLTDLMNEVSGYEEQTIKNYPLGDEGGPSQGFSSNAIEDIMFDLKNILKKWETKRYDSAEERYKEYFLDIEELVKDYEMGMTHDYEDKKDDETERALSVDAPDRFEEQIRKKIRKEINRIFQ